MKRTEYLSIAITAFIAVTGGSGIQCRSAEKNCSEQSPADSLKTRLSAIVESGRTMYGHHDDTAYGHSWKSWDKNEAGRSDVLETSGKLPAVFSTDVAGADRGDSVNIEGIPFSFIRKEVARFDREGGISAFCWHPNNPIDGGDSWSVADTTIVARMVSEPEKYHAQLYRLADFFKSLTDKEGNRIPVIFRPWHEHTGGWFFWGSTNCTPEQYRYLWTEMRHIFDERGVDNVVWAYSPDRVTDKETYMDRYPGDEYVDILGIDIYHFDGEKGTQAYRDAVERGLGIVSSVAAERGKIPAFTETGLESITVDGWYDEVLLPLLKRYHPAYVVTWRNAFDKPQHFYAPYKGHPAEESFRKFTSDPSIIMLDGMQNYK